MMIGILVGLIMICECTHTLLGHSMAVALAAVLYVVLMLYYYDIKDKL